jgi:hypothetical protein
MNDDNRWDVTWDHHPDVESMDEFIKAEFSKDEADYLMTAYQGTDHIHDLKHNMENKIDEAEELYKKLREIVDNLPDDEDREYVVGTCEICGDGAEEEVVLHEVHDVQDGTWEGSKWVCEDCKVGTETQEYV